MCVCVCVKIERDESVVCLNIERDESVVCVTDIQTHTHTQSIQDTANILGSVLLSTISLSPCPDCRVVSSILLRV